MKNSKRLFSWVLCFSIVFAIISGVCTVSAATEVTAKNYLSGINGVSYVRSMSIADTITDEYTITSHKLEMYDVLPLYLSNNGKWEKIINPIRTTFKSVCGYEAIETDNYGDKEYVYFLTENSTTYLMFHILGETVSQKILNESGLVYVRCCRITEIPKNFTGISFSNAAYTYDGTEKSISVTGTLPTGAKVEYTNERATNAGTYNATAKITCEGYNALVLKATLKINPAEITVRANDKQMVKGEPIPKLDYTKKGKLYGNDKITGELKVNTNGKTVGDFDITQGTLAVSSNYKLTFEKGKLSVVEKTPLNVTVSEDGTNFTVNPVDVPVGNTAVLALYNGKQLIEMQSATFNGTDIQFTTDKAYTKAKVMVFESLSNIKPVCGAETVK